MRPRVLVLLAAYNGAPWIREQLDSVLAQERVDVTVAVRDDGSTDRTLEELERFAGDPRLNILPSRTPTGSAAGNFLCLIREYPADGADFVAFCDQDDLWDRDKLARACRSIAAGAAAAGYSSATLAAWKNGRRKALRPSGAPTPSDFLFEGAGQGCTFVLSIEFYRRLQRFMIDHPELTRSLHYHDWSAYALARTWGLEWCFDSEPSMTYRQHAGNDTGARGTLNGLLKRVRLIRNGWYRAQLSSIAKLCVAASATNPVVLAWHSTFVQPDGWRRRFRLVMFCLQGGRRRARDNLMLVLAAVLGWV